MANRPTRTRHAVLWLTVLVYLITYMDRVVISTAAPAIQEEFGFSVETLGVIFAAFQLSYALFQIPGGWLGDRFGPRKVLTGIVVWWSSFTALTAMTWNAGSMIVCRFLFGMGEAGAFPNATRSLSRWMLPSERGWAQGITHAGARLGGAITPPLVAAIILAWGWRSPFLIFSVLGVLWAIFWYWWYRDTPREHKSVNPEELTLIEESLGHGKAKVKRKVPWGTILRSPQMWTLAAMYFCYAYSINIFLQWFPTYMSDGRGQSLGELGIATGIVLGAGVIGDMLGGAWSDLWYKRTGNLKLARRGVAIFGFLVAGVVMPIAVLSDDVITSVAWFCLGVFALELTVGVSWAVTLDIGHEFAGSVSALMNTCGNIGGTIAGVLTGFLVGSVGWNMPFFVVSGLLILAAILFLGIDASRRLYLDVPEPETAVP